MKDLILKNKNKVVFINENESTVIDLDDKENLLKSSSKQIEQYKEQIRKNNLIIEKEEEKISKIISKTPIVYKVGHGISLLTLTATFIAIMQFNNFYDMATIFFMGGLSAIIFNEAASFVNNRLHDDYKFESNIVDKKMRNNEFYKEKIKELEDTSNKINNTVSKSIAPIDHTNDFDKEVSKKLVLKNNS